MKKILLFLFLFAVVLPLSVSAIGGGNKATVYNPTTCEKRVVMIGDEDAFDGGFVLQKYHGQCELESQGFNLGYAPTTAYDATLTDSITATDSTIPVSSTNDRDGAQLPCSSTNKCYFTIDPGGDAEESVVCKGVSSTSFTSCTRGLVATGESETASSTLQYSHNAGATIINTNISQFFSNFMDLWNAQTATGTKTFVSYPQIQDSSVSPTADAEFATKIYVDDVGAGGFTSSNASTSRAVEVYGTSPETVGVNASSSLGIGINEATDGSLYLKASTSANLAFDNDGEVYVDGSDDITWTGDFTNTGSTSLVDLNVSGDTTLASTSIDGTNLSPLIDGSETSLHAHAYNYVTGVNLGNYTQANDTSSEIVVATTTLTAGELDSNDGVRITFRYSNTDSPANDNAVFRVKFGTSAVFTFIGGSGDESGIGEIYVMNNNSTSSQRWRNFQTRDDSPFAQDGTGSAGIDTTAEVNITFTIAWANGTQDDATASFTDTIVEVLKQ